MGIEDLEEIDELFAQEQEATDKSDNLAAKYAKFEALANDDWDTLASASTLARGSVCFHVFISLTQLNIYSHALASFWEK